MDPNIVITEKPSLSSNISSPASSPSVSIGSTGDNISVSPVSNKSGWGKTGFYLIIIIGLAILGFNIFKYLSNATDNLSKLFGPLASLAGGGVTSAVRTSAEGTKGIVNTTADVIDSGLDELEKKLDNNTVRNKIDSRKKEKNNKKGEESKYEGKAVESRNKRKTRGPSPDDAGSRTQGKVGKTGYCYIGEDRGFRSCIRVDADDECMSGDIFPTKELCINPTLRE